jgi:hypothetical protein
MKKTIVLISLFLLTAIGFYVFNKMGGFNEVHIEVVEDVNIDLVGRKFKGIPQDEKLTKAFQEIESIKNNNPGAALYTIYYSEPAGKLDTMEVFVGLDSKWIGDTTGFETISFSNENAIVATITAHRFVMPSPLKIKNKIIVFAKENSLPEPVVFIDQIVGLNEVKVIGIKKTK